MNALQPFSEATMVAGLQTRNAAFFTPLYQCYAGTLLGVLQRIVHDPDDAADLLQDTFVKIWQQGHRYDSSQGRLFNWLLTITRRTAFDYLRTKKVFARNTNVIISNTIDLSFTPCYHYIGFQQQVDAILEDKHQIIINLAYWKGYTQEDIAKELNLPIGTVKTRIRMALQQLRAVLAQE